MAEARRHWRIGYFSHKSAMEKLGQESQALGPERSTKRSGTLGHSALPTPAATGRCPPGSADDVVDAEVDGREMTDGNQKPDGNSGRLGGRH